MTHIILFAHGKPRDHKLFVDLINNKKLYAKDSKGQETWFKPFVHEIKLYDIVVSQETKEELFKTIEENFNCVKRVNSLAKKIRRLFRWFTWFKTIERKPQWHNKLSPDMDIGYLFEVEDPYIKGGTAEGI